MKADAQQQDLPGNKAGWFTTTHWSMVLAAAGGASPGTSQAMERLCCKYWYPLYAYIRWRGHTPEDGEDLTQEFFARLLEKNFLAQVAPEKGKFRSFLLAAVNHFLANERDRAMAQKRGRGQTPISLDAEAAEGRFALEPICSTTPEKLFEQRWAATLLDQAFAQLREEYAEAGNAGMFEELSKFLTDDPGSGGYAPVAQRLDMAPNAVAVAVHRLRQDYRECVRAQVQQTVATPADLEDEMRYLFSVLAR